MHSSTEISIATLLSQFTGDKLVAPKALEKKLGCQDRESIEKLQIVLDALEKVGILVKEKGKYRRVYEDDVVEAKLRCSSKGFCFAIQDAEEAEDVYIRESNLSTAWNGDRVLVKVTKEGSRRRSPEGEVRLILERANPSLLARVKQTDKGYRAVPLDDRLLFELNLEPNEEDLQEAIDYLVHVEVLRYPLGPQPPSGKIARILGSNAEAAADTDIVCCKHDLRRSFSEKILKAAENLPAKLSKAQLKQRLDIRKLNTVAFAAEENAQGVAIENAFTLKKLSSQQWQLGVHIADVAAYVASEDLLDEEAKRRGTAVYLGDTALPLFPDALIHQCALIPGEERLTLSVLLTLSEAGEVVEFEIQPSVIQVDRLLSYAQAQSIINQQPIEETQASDNPQLELSINPSEDAQDLPEWVSEMLTNLWDLSLAARQQRLQRGAFDLKLEESASPYPDEGRLGVLVISSPEIRPLLTELTILTNYAVALHLQALSVPGIYCIQSSPDPAELQDLIKLVNNLRLPFEIQDEEEIYPSDFKRLTQLFPQSPSARILNHLLQATFKSASYSSMPGSHFGLAYPTSYTHCVSPLRRYADLLVQRVLNGVFEHGRDRRTIRAKETVNLRHSSCHGNINWNVLPPIITAELENQIFPAITHLNDREKTAEDAEKDLQGLKKAELMKERTGEVFQGLITGVQSYGFFVEMEDLLVEGLVHVSSLKDDWYEFRSRQGCLVGRKNRTAYRLGDRVEVQVKSVDYYRQQIDLVTVSGGSEASNEDMEEA